MPKIRASLPARAIIREKILMLAEFPHPHQRLATSVAAVRPVCYRNRKAPLMTAARVLFLSLFVLAAFGQPYTEPYRPQYHFSPRQNWTNDPNGLVFFEGEYHLFFQYNPFGNVWGHMSWGHAVSPDLVHWKELPVALPEENGIMIFTGSTVIDHSNTSGFCLDGKPCMVAIYTGHTGKTETRPGLQTQNLAFSNDRGRAWTKYPNNPVLNLNMADFRDPNVFWSEQAGRWIMAVSLPDEHKVAFYGSPDLKSWRHLSDFGPAGATSGQWECPDIFELPVDGDASKTRWVVKVGLNPGAIQGGSGEQYFIGSFDGTRFVNDNPAALTLWTDYGKDCYCALTFNNLPPSQSPLMLGWMNNWQYADKVPTQTWRGQMTVPRELSLRTFPEGIRLVQKPLSGLAALREKHRKASGTDLPLKGRSFAIAASFDPKGAKQAGWKLLSRNGAYTEIGYDAARHEVYVDRTHSGEVAFSPHFPARTAAPWAAPAGALTFDILVDRNSIEVFAAGGRVAITNLVFAPDATRLAFFSEGDSPAKFLSAETWGLRSVR
jgi:fructan beta-fructosidase